MYTDAVEDEQPAEEMVDSQNEEVDQEDAWAVISAYFEERGLVRQQLDSFNEFVSSSMQEIVDDQGTMQILPEKQYQVGDDDDEDEEVEKMHEVEFGQIYLSKPVFSEADGENNVLFPREARLRNLTYVLAGCGTYTPTHTHKLNYAHRYEAPLYVDVKYRELQRVPGEPDFSEVDSKTYAQVHLGHVPIMLRSDFCSLAEASETALQEVGECPYDQVRFDWLLTGCFHLVV